MNIRVAVFATILIIQTCYAPPVTQNKKDEHKEDAEINGLEDYMEYHRYLKEVVNALESDPEFRKKLEKADEEEIKSGKIAEELEFVSHHVRTRLDEIKRVELERLKALMEQKRKLENESNSVDEDPMHHHLDHKNPHTFEIEDLKKLIAKTTEDLAEADKKRKDEFKHYELEKEFQKQEKLNHTNGDERQKLENQIKEMEQKHKTHEKLHQPGHKAQLEEVWEEQDQMQQDFDPKTFFMLHDIDGNGLWDQEEVKALFIKELDKMYQQGAPEDDMRERAEDMERMRESVFKEMDTNGDGFIDFNEFIQQTNSNDFKQDNGWQGVDEQRPFTDEELAEYIRQHEANKIPQGYQHYPDPNMHPGAYQVPPAYQQVPQGSYHPNAPPQGAYQPNAVPPAGYHPNAVPPAGYHPNAVPPAGYHPNAVPPAGYHQNAVPPAGYHPNAVPPNHPNDVPQGQFHPGQVPQSPPQPLADNNVGLNTNEVYTNQQQQVKYQQNPQPPQPNYQQQHQQGHLQGQPQVQSQGQTQGQPQVQQGHPQIPLGQPQVQQGQPQIQQGQAQVQQGQPQIQQGQAQVQQGQPPIQQGQPQVQQGQPQQFQNNEIPK